MKNREMYRVRYLKKPLKYFLIHTSGRIIYNPFTETNFSDVLYLEAKNMFYI